MYLDLPNFRWTRLEEAFLLPKNSFKSAVLPDLGGKIHGADHDGRNTLSRPISEKSRFLTEFAIELFVSSDLAWRRCLVSDTRQKVPARRMYAMLEAWFAWHLPRRHRVSNETFGAPHSWVVPSKTQRRRRSPTSLSPFHRLRQEPHLGDLSEKVNVCMPGAHLSNYPFPPPMKNHKRRTHQNLGEPPLPGRAEQRGNMWVLAETEKIRRIWRI